LQPLGVHLIGSDGGIDIAGGLGGGNRDDRGGDAQGDRFKFPLEDGQLAVIGILDRSGGLVRSGGNLIAFGLSRRKIGRRDGREAADSHGNRGQNDVP
jgi:hypothetical protein